MITFISKSERDTFEFAREMAKHALPGQVYCLSGTLGAGKTVFAKGFADGLGIKESVTSPTFAIVNEYAGRLRLYHFDVYRVEVVSEMDDAGFEEFFYGDGVCIVEWAELVEEIIPEDAIWITIVYEGDNRVLTVRP